jgi:glycosyltransferase involved in cell wall biosynthesis
MAKISVVMSVFNGAEQLPATLDSILAQTETDYELIVVDDGSKDATPAILRSYASRDSRLRIIPQENRGLTLALIAGCAAAQGPWIARHDCGDTSMPERLRKQLDAVRDDVVLVSCAARYVGPGGELLYISKAEGDDVRSALLGSGIETIRGIPHHGTAMFRRDAYVAAGGYRQEFRYAQDVDLWIRLAARGRFAIVNEVLYEAAYDVTAISGTRRHDQVELARISIALRDGGNPDTLLEQARHIGSIPRPRTRSDEARSLYFVASCLKRNGDMRYKRYARDAVRRDPLHARAWWLLLK